MKKNKSGFTLIELLVVIAIIGLLSTLSILALNQARARARDAKRISDVRQIQTALELYYNDEGDYPETDKVKAGRSISSSSGDRVYLASIPKPPTPSDGSGCSAVSTDNYDYAQTGAGVTGNASYTIKYCLGANVNEVAGGVAQYATPAGIASESTQTNP